ncbi:TPA: hypothetical protein VGS89_003037 [Vibrio cholerae]|nr:hypothetical protein [Vibrio cholerae]
MASGKTHLVVGAAVGLTVALADNKKQAVSHLLCDATTPRSLPLIGKL